MAAGGEPVACYGLLDSARQGGAIAVCYINVGESGVQVKKTMLADMFSILGLDEESIFVRFSTWDF